MKIIKVSDSQGSFCSSELDAITKELKKHIQKSMKERNNEKFLIEIFDINDGDVTLSAGDRNPPSSQSNTNQL